MGKLNKQNLARQCVEEHITPLCYNPEYHYYISRSDDTEVREALGLASLWRELTDQERMAILTYPLSEDTIFEFSSARPREGSGSHSVEKEFTFKPTRVEFVDGKPLIEGTFHGNWYRENGEKVMFAPVDFTKEYALELEKSRTMSDKEKGLWVEQIVTSEKPIYQFDIVDMLKDIGHREGNYWPFYGLQTGDTISLSLQARLISDLGTHQPEFAPVDIDQQVLLQNGLCGNSWVIETDGAIFVSGDIEKELKAELSRRQEKEMLIKTLAERYAPLDMDFSKHYILYMISRSDLALKSQDQSQQSLAFSDIKKGDPITIDYVQLYGSERYDTPDYRHLFSNGRHMDEDITIDQVWTDGEDIVIEAVRNGVHSVFSTLNFQQELNREMAKLEYEAKSVAEFVVDTGTSIDAPTLLLSNMQCLDPATKEPLDPTEIHPGDKIIISGIQNADMRFRWNGTMAISTEIQVDQIFARDDGIAISAKDGPLFTDVDCRERFGIKLESISYKNHMAEQEAAHNITVQMDDTYDYPYQDRGYDDD